MRHAHDQTGLHTAPDAGNRPGAGRPLRIPLGPLLLLGRVALLSALVGLASALNDSDTRSHLSTVGLALVDLSLLSAPEGDLRIGLPSVADSLDAVDTLRAPDSLDTATSAHSDSASTPLEETGVEIARGRASYYGNELAGRRTANGERFDPARLTAAHRTLPFGSRVRVTDTRTGRSVIVRINDRGPFTGARIIDISKAAAHQIGMVRSGTALVRLELLDEE